MISERRISSSILIFSFALFGNVSSASAISLGLGDPLSRESNNGSFNQAMGDKQSIENIDICDEFTILKFGGELGIKVRAKPRGDCGKCCQRRSGDVQLKLFTNSKTKNPFVLPHIKERSLNYDNLTKASKLIIYIHGFTEITELGSADNIKNAFLSKHKNYAVLIVDWSDLGSAPWYFQAVKNVDVVAQLLATFLESYIDDGTINIDDIHVIGFSLGAHVAGNLGKFLRKGLKLRRITALDPALPGFNRGERNMLSRDDAEFVDVIHTDGGHFGITEALGHVDFYPNGGTPTQPGCSPTRLALTGRLYDIVSCSHNRAHKYFVESIYSPFNFPAIKCSEPYKENKVCSDSDVANMGIAVDPRSRGSYFLTTNKKFPYGRTTKDRNHLRYYIRL